jgi:GntR family transcriptional repressor for pyruvate dehydrogenase complex
VTVAQVQADRSSDDGGWSPSRPSTAPEQIADRILTAVAVGVLTPGEALPAERELAATLRVARSTVRQAIARLQALGILEARRGRGGGTFVLPFDPGGPEAAAVRQRLAPLFDEVATLLDYRCLIEELVARTAALRRTRADLAAMRAALRRYEQATDPAASRAADHELHAALAAATGNPHLADLSHQLVGATTLGFAADPYSELLHTQALDQHQDLVVAVTEKDADAAASLARTHFQVTTIEPWHAALEPGGPQH